MADLHNTTLLDNATSAPDLLRGINDVTGGSLGLAIMVLVMFVSFVAYYSRTEDLTATFAVSGLLGFIIGVIFAGLQIMHASFLAIPLVLIGASIIAKTMTDR